MGGGCVCPSTRHGPDCAYDVCGSSAATLPGLFTEVFVFAANNGLGNAPRSLAAVDVMPNVNASFNYDNLRPGRSSPSGRFAVTYAGTIRTFVSGPVLFRCRLSGSFCRVFLDGAPVSTGSYYNYAEGSVFSFNSAPLGFVASEQRRLKVEFEVRGALVPVCVRGAPTRSRCSPRPPARWRCSGALTVALRSSRFLQARAPPRTLRRSDTAGPWRREPGSLGGLP